MSAPGKVFRKGITLPELVQMFPDDETAEQWFVETRWPDGIRCAHCDSERTGVKANHPSLPYHCSDCRSFFSVKTNSVMRDSDVGCQKWAMAIYLMTTNLKGVSPIELLRNIGVTQKTVRDMEHRIREGWETDVESFLDPVDADETYGGGKESNNNLRGTRPNRGRTRTGRNDGPREVLCTKCGWRSHAPKYDTCRPCMQESLVLCGSCGQERHDPKYDTCRPCMQKILKESLVFCDSCRRRTRKPKYRTCRECWEYPEQRPHWSSSWKSSRNKVKHWSGR